MTGKKQQQAEALLTELTARLKSSLGDRLVSLTLYGSASQAGLLDQMSDFNILCVLDRITTDELAKSELIFRWWLERGHPLPLLMTAQEVQTSADCFPMEYQDMRALRRVLAGTDVIETLSLDKAAYRTQVEHELRTKQIRLRQKAAELLGAGPRLLKLLGHSVSTFCVLGRHALILSGKEAIYHKLEVVTALETTLGSKLDSFRAILALRETGKLASGLNPKTVLDGYLNEIGALVKLVDGLGK